MVVRGPAVVKSAADLLAEAQVADRAAHAQAIGAGRDRPAVLLDVPDLQRAQRHVDVHRGAGAGLDMGDGEAGEPADRPLGSAGRTLEVGLDHLMAVSY